MQSRPLMRAVTALAAALLVAGLGHRPADASTTLPDRFIELEFAHGFPNPTALRVAPDGRLFVLGKAGERRIAECGMTEAPAPILDLGNTQEPQFQRLDSLLGKALRINRDGTIPDDNPFVDRLGGSLRASYSAEPPTAWTPSQTQTYEVTLVNRGEIAWDAGGVRPVRLGVSFGGREDDPLSGRVTDQRFPLPQDVEPGESLMIQVSVTAPSRPGVYILRHQLVLEGVAWFDDLARTEVRIAPGWLTLVALGAVVAAALGGTGWYVARSTRRSRR